MFRLILAVCFVLSVVNVSGAKVPPVCEGTFAKAAKVKSKPVKFTAKKLNCRSLRDGPKGFQLQCIGDRDVRVAADRIAAGWANCLADGGFSETPRGKNDRMTITELRNRKRGIVCTLLNSAPEPGIENWSVKMKCFGPR